MKDFFLGKCSCFLGFGWTNIYSESPFISIVEIIKREELKLEEGQFQCLSFHTLEEALAFKEATEDPDKVPTKVTVYGYAVGEWLQIDQIASARNNLNGL
jgi:hypothetical protein